LAALRYWQRERNPLSDLLVPPDDYLTIATNSGEYERLDSQEIEELCDRLQDWPTLQPHMGRPPGRPRRQAVQGPAT